MTTFPEEFNLIDIDPEKDEQELVALYEKELDKKLQPAQSERVQVSIVNMVATTLKMKFNEALKNQFLPYAKGIFLDCIGAFFGCPRLKASQASSVLEVKLYEIYSFDKILPKGTEVESSDGEYLFTTDEDLIIPAGELQGVVGITSVKAGSVLNYKKGEINSLIKHYEYVESVINVVDAEGGSDEEKDEPYRERLQIAAEKSSTAGPKLAYEYYAMAADKTIVDVECECKQENASIEYNGVVYTEDKKQIDNDQINAIIDYYTGEFLITIKETSTTLKVKIPPCARVDLYVLTENGEASELVLSKVKEAVNAEERRPLSDLVVAQSAIKKDFSINGLVEIKIDADFDNVKNAVIKALETYFIKLRQKLKQEVIPSDISRIIQNVDGVHSVELNNVSRLPALIDTYYNGEIGTLEFKRVS